MWAACTLSILQLFFFSLQNPSLEKVHDIAAHKDTITTVEFSPTGKQVS